MRKLWMFLLFHFLISHITFGAEKVILLEETTSAGWGTCARGAATVDRLSSKYKENLIPLQYHYQLAADNKKFDPMHCFLGKKFSKFAGMPNLGYQVDRGCPKGTFIKTTLSSALSDAESYMDFSDVPCGIKVVHNWNTGTRQITGEVQINFDMPPEMGDYKLMLVVVQDSIYYKQYDYSMSGDFGVPYVNPSIGYLDPYYHNHTIRDAIIVGDSLWGEHFASDPSDGDIFNVQFDYTLPKRFKFSGPGTITIPSKYDPEKVEDDQISLVAFVTRSKSEVVNAAKVKLLDGSTENTKTFQIKNNNNNFKIKNGILTVNFNIKEIFSLEIYTLKGVQIKSLELSGSLNLREHNIPAGKYLLKITSTLDKNTVFKRWINL